MGLFLARDDVDCFCIGDWRRLWGLGMEFEAGSDAYQEQNCKILSLLQDLVDCC